MEDEIKGMSHWNYRIIEHDITEPDYMAVCEVYYAKDGKPIGWCNASAPCGESAEDIKAEIEMMKAALDKPVLKESDFKSGAGS